MNVYRLILEETIRTIRRTRNLFGLKRGKNHPEFELNMYERGVKRLPPPNVYRHTDQSNYNSSTQYIPDNRPYTITSVLRPVSLKDAIRLYRINSLYTNDTYYAQGHPHKVELSDEEKVPRHYVKDHFGKGTKQNNTKESPITTSTASNKSTHKTEEQSSSINNTISHSQSLPIHKADPKPEPKPEPKPNPQSTTPTKPEPQSTTPTKPEPKPQSPTPTKSEPKPQSSVTTNKQSFWKNHWGKIAGVSGVGTAAGIGGAIYHHKKNSGLLNKIKNNPGKAAGLGIGALAAGAGVAALIHHLRKKKKQS